MVHPSVSVCILWLLSVAVVACDMISTGLSGAFADMQSVMDCDTAICLQSRAIAVMIALATTEIARGSGDQDARQPARPLLNQWVSLVAK